MPGSLDTNDKFKSPVWSVITRSVSKQENIGPMRWLHGKDICQWTHHHHGDDAGLGSSPRLANWGQPAAQLFQESHRGFLPNNQLTALRWEQWT